MDGNQELERLQARKEELLRQSDAYRRLLGAEWARVWHWGAAVETGIGVIKKAAPLWLFLAPIAGFLFMRHWRRKRLPPDAPRAVSPGRLAALWGLARGGYQAWKFVQRIRAGWEQSRKSESPPA